MFHINAPGQEDGAASLPADYEYPSMEQLAEQVQEVLNKLSIVKYIGIGEFVVSDNIETKSTKEGATC